VTFSRPPDDAPEPPSPLLPLPLPQAVSDSAKTAVAAASLPLIPRK
jgi:hypothetical protein